MCKCSFLFQTVRIYKKMFNFVEAYCLSGLAGLYKQSTNVVDIIITKCNNFNRLKGKKAEKVACFKKVNVFLFV